MKQNHSPSPENQKKLRRHTISVLGLLFTVIAVICGNFLASGLTDRFDLTLDLTANQLYQLTEETKGLLTELEKPVSITILAAEDDFKKDTYDNKVYTLLGKYQQLAGNMLDIQYIDPYTNPNLLERYDTLAASLQAGSLIVSCEKNTRVLNTEDFYTTQENAYYSGYYDVTGFQGEQALTSAIVSVSNGKMPAVYILQGHNESISTSLSAMFANAGYTANTCNLTEAKAIPQDAAILVISLPQADYTETEINQIDSFIKSGGDVMVFDGTACPTELPRLYRYLQEWGITVQADMVLDADYNIDEPADLLAQLTDTDSNQRILDSGLTLVTPNAKSLSAMLPDSVTDRRLEVVMESRDTSYAKILTDETQYSDTKKTDADTDGPFPLAVLASYTGNHAGGQLFLCSAGMMMSDDLMHTSSLLNYPFLSHIVSLLQPEIDMISIPAKSLAAEPLLISSKVQFIIFLLLACVSLAVFLAGIIVFIHRRRL